MQELYKSMTRSQSELIAIALSFVTDCRCPQSVFEHAAELEKLGMHGAAIPHMRAHKWKAIIDSLITSGKLIERDGCVVAAGDEDKLEQLPLF